jgi:hypothetical protein
VVVVTVMPLVAGKVVGVAIVVYDWVTGVPMVAPVVEISVAVIDPAPAATVSDTLQGVGVSEPVRFEVCEAPDASVVTTVVDAKVTPAGDGVVLLVRVT